MQRLMRSLPVFEIVFGRRERVGCRRLVTLASLRLLPQRRIDPAPGRPTLPARTVTPEQARDKRDDPNHEDGGAHDQNEAEN